MSEFAIGTKVRCFIPGHGTDASEGWFIGTMHYGDEIGCIADEQAHGMPVNKGHLTALDTGHDADLGHRLRNRYLKTYGEKWFQPLPSSPNATPEASSREALNPSIPTDREAGQ